MKPILALSDISKRFEENGVLAVDGASLELEQGVVAAVIGENGAGKSTLMHIVAGTVIRDGGTVTVNGRMIEPQHHGAADHGIVMSFQQPRLDPDLTVLENLFLGAEPRMFGIFFDRVTARNLVARAAPDFSSRLLGRRLSSLSSGQQRMVSLVAALLRLPSDPGVLILDEPTEATTPQEAERVFEIIRRAASQGHAVILITHKLAEVSRVADVAIVMRRGRVVRTLHSPIQTEDLASELGATADVREADRSARNDTKRAARLPAQPHQTEHDALILDGVTVADRDHLRLNAVSLRVRPGEIVGCVGVRENGLEALEDVVSGWQIPTAGRMAIAGRWCTHRSVDRRIAELRYAGLGYVPSSRFTRGASLDSSLQDNLVARARGCLQRSGIFVGDWVSRFVAHAGERFSITGSEGEPLRHLSGGNVQKSILAREITSDSPLLLVCEPGWGLDLATRARLKEELRHAAGTGSGVLILSTDVDDALEFCDRVIVFSGGSIAADLKTEQTDRSQIARLLGSGLPSLDRSGKAVENDNAGEKKEPSVTHG